MNVQEPVQSNMQMFKDAYNNLLNECIQRRKAAKFSQDFIADWLQVDRRKIIELEAGKIKVGLLLKYADKLDIEVELKIIKH